MSGRWSTPDGEPDEAAYPDPPGGGILLAILGGLAAAGSVLLVFVPPLAVVAVAVSGVLTGAAVRQARHVLTTTIAAVLPPMLTSFSATCLTGEWGWLVVGIFVAAVVLLFVTPMAFGLGRLLRSRVGATGYLVLRTVLVVAGVLSAISWAIVLLNAVQPGYCPPAP